MSQHARQAKSDLTGLPVPLKLVAAVKACLRWLSPLGKIELTEVEKSFVRQSGNTLKVGIYDGKSCFCRFLAEVFC